MTSNRTFAQGLGRNLLLSLIAMAFLAAFTVPPLLMPPTGSSTVPADNEDLSGSTTLIEQHDCWTGAAPKDMEGKIPGHVVVTVGERTTYAGPKMVQLALDQVFNGVDHDLVVRAFCR